MERILGLLMRAYRRSSLYPRWGKRLAGLLSLVSRGKPVVRTVNGVTYRLDRREVIDASLYYSGTFEAGAEHVIASTLRPGMTAVDVGANVGYHTFGMAKAVGREGLVVAIEPMSGAFERMRVNAELNDFPQVKYVQAGLSDAVEGPKEVDFQYSYRLDSKPERSKEVVEITTLDDITERLGLSQVDFVKIDVDGFEGKIFRGAEKTFTRWRPTILFEVSPVQMASHGDHAHELVESLVALGYSLQTEERTPVPDINAVLDETADLSVNLLAIPRVS